MLEAADRDGNGTLDKEEVAAALRALGFSHLQEKQIDGILSRADADENEVIDFEEFVRERKTLPQPRVSASRTAPSSASRLYAPP